MASQDAGPSRSPRSRSTSPASRTRRPRPPDLNFWELEDTDNPLPSPPYKRNASNPFLSFAEESPAYRSRTSIDDINELTPMREDFVEVKHTGSDDQIDSEARPRPTLKAARFEADITSPVHPHHAPFNRTDTFESDTMSISPSIGDTDDENDYYDWSGEDDLVDEQAKFAQSMGVARRKRWGFRKYIAFIFGSLVGSTLLSALLVTPALLIHFFWFKPHPTEHRRYVKDNLEAWLFWIAANLTISWYLALCIDVFPILLRFLISAFWGHVSETVKTRIELYNSVKDTIKPLFYAASGWVSWIIVFANIYHLRDMDTPANSRAQYTVRLYQVIELLFFFALVICAEQMLQHAIAFSFHRTAYKDRLDSLQNALWAIERLRTYRPKKSHIKSSSAGFGSRSFNALNLATLMHGSRPGTPSHSRPPSRPMTPVSRPPSPSRAPGADEVGFRSDPEILSHNQAGSTIVRRASKGKRADSRVSGWMSHKNSPSSESDPNSPKTHVSDIDSPQHNYPPATSSPLATSRENSTHLISTAASTFARTVKTAVLHDARNLEGRDNADLSGLVWDVSSSYEAKRLARSIYVSFRHPTRNYLISSDFHPAFATEEEADRAFSVFDKDGNGDVSRGEIKTALILMYRERRSLSRSMRDVSQALGSLNQLLLVFAMIILMFISLSIFEVNVGSSLTSLYSLGIGLSFIFKNTASNAFDAIMFLFVTHPFDTGDRCFIDDENLVVKKMGLFATVFQRFDGTESYYFNSQLFNKFIINARRSDKTAEGLTLQVHWKTPWDKLDKLADCLNEWLKTEPNRWFQPDTSVTPQNIKYMRHLEVTVGIGHNSNWQDWHLRLARKTAFSAAVNYYCRQLGIQAHESIMPIAYADRDTLEVTAFPGDEYYGSDVEYEAEEAPAQETKEMGRLAYLGFQPPSDTPIHGVRARKSKGKKTMLRTVGADG